MKFILKITFISKQKYLKITLLHTNHHSIININKNKINCHINNFNDLNIKEENYFFFNS